MRYQNFHRIAIAFLVISTVLIGCVDQSRIRPASPTPQQTVTLFLTITPVPTNTLHPTITPTASPKATSTPRLGAGWYLIPELTPYESVRMEPAKSFIGLRVPPMPEGIVEEFSYVESIGEAPPDIIVRKVFIARRGNARILWLGVLYKYRFTDAQIYDSIPLPQTEANDVLIPFTCFREDGSGYPMIAIATRPNPGEDAKDIRYAWRIDPTSLTLRPVYYQDIICTGY